MATKSGALSRIASKAMAAGRVHIGKVLKGEETLPEAAGGTVENLLSGSRAASASKTIAKDAPKKKLSAKKKPTTHVSSRRKSQSK
jgi:hypothetical protein